MVLTCNAQSDFRLAKARAGCAPSCGKRAWSDHRNQPACDRNDACLKVNPIARANGAAMDARGTHPGQLAEPCPTSCSTRSRGPDSNKISEARPPQTRARLVLGALLAERALLLGKVHLDDETRQARHERGEGTATSVDQAYVRSSRKIETPRHPARATDKAMQQLGRLERLFGPRASTAA